MSNHYLITGGAGFIGSNYVSRLIQRGESVTIFDNLTRIGSRVNLKWLLDNYGRNSFRVVEGDVRDSNLLTTAAKEVDIIVHLAAQVAVTTSVKNPREDFEINALGTLNVLEAARLSRKIPVVLYASTNKVYGCMKGVRVIAENSRYRYADLPLGVSETQSLDFHSPYGCSKGAGDQYVRDYYRIYDLPTVVLRQSCIYGPRQFGVEEQGWVAWFIIAAVCGCPITIYGDGKQVRDMLYVEDLLDVYDAAISHIDVAAGQIYNIGGGSLNTLSVWEEFGPRLKDLLGREVLVTRADWRLGDQKIYISDIRKAEQELGWTIRVGVSDGICRLYKWVDMNRQLFTLL